MHTLSFLLRAGSLALLAAALLWAAQRPAAGPSYFPLASGLTWEYEVTDGSGPPARLRVTNEGERTLGRQRASAQRLEQDEATGYRFVVAGRDRVVVVAEQGPGQAAPVALEPPAVLLRLPPARGATWESELRTVALAPGTAVPTVTTVESVADRISVPAGVFEGCVRLASNGRVNVEMVELYEPAQAIVGTRLWYCPGVGLTKVLWRESSNRPQLPQTQIVYQLARVG